VDVFFNDSSKGGASGMSIPYEVMMKNWSTLGVGGVNPWYEPINDGS
jgi:hypothetical protein